MSTDQFAGTDRYQSASSAGTRPRTLTAAVGAAVGVAVLNIISAVSIAASVDDIVRNQIAGNPGAGADPVSPDQVDMASDRAQSLSTLFSGLAYSTIFWSLVLAVLAYFALRGGRTTRILAAVILVVSAALKSVDALGSLPAMAVAADTVVGILALVAIVLFFLPASNRYGKARRAAKNATS